MARIKRIVIPDTPHHVTQRGIRSMNIFFKEKGSCHESPLYKIKRENIYKYKYQRRKK